MNRSEDVDVVSFARNENRGVLLGLSLLQLVVVAVTLVVSVVLFASTQGRAWFVAIPLLVIGSTLGLVKVQKRSILDWARIALTRRRVRSRGKGVHLSGFQGTEVDRLDELFTRPEDHLDDGAAIGEGPTWRCRINGRGKVTLGKPALLNLPGDLKRLRLFEHVDGSAFVWDPDRRVGFIAALVETTTAFSLESADEKRGRIEAFTDTLTAISRIRGVHSAQFTDQTSMVSGDQILDYYERTKTYKQNTGRRAGAEVNPFYDAAYQERLSRTDGLSIHEGWLCVAVDATLLKGIAREQGGGLVGIISAVAGIRMSIENALLGTGTTIGSWMNGRDLAARIRTAFDPASGVEVFSRVGASAGAAPAAAGPMVVDPRWTSMITDSAVHRTWMISEWPRRVTRAGFLEGLVFSGNVRHTVTLAVKPVSVGKAMREVEGVLSDLQVAERMNEKADRRTTLRTRKTGEDQMLQEEALEAGAAPMRILGLVTVSAQKESELEAAVAEVMGAAAASSCEFRVLAGQQEAGFVASALPLTQAFML